MPDRAVVDDDYTPDPCTCTIYGSNRPCPQHGMFNQFRSPADETAVRKEQAKPKTPPPRSLVALSDDGQWLVVLAPEPESDGQHYWHFIRWLNGESSFWDHDEFWADTGQDANEVLAAFLAERES